MIARLDALLAKPVSTRSLGIARILVGIVAFIHLKPFAADGLDGRTYQDYFHHSYAGWYPELPETAYAWLLVAGCVAAVAMVAGLWTPIATKLTFGVIAYNLFLSTTQVHNNRAYLAAIVGLLALAPCGRAFSLDALWRRWRGLPVDLMAPGWPLWLLRFECSLVYAASGFSKLIDPDWFGGTVTWGRLIEKEANVRQSFLPGGIEDLLLDRSFHTIAAKVIIATELFIATGLWWRRTRWLALIAAVCFHIMIEFTARVQVFSYLGIAVLIIWADPALPWLRLPKLRPFRSRTLAAAPPD